MQGMTKAVQDGIAAAIEGYVGDITSLHSGIKTTATHLPYYNSIDTPTQTHITTRTRIHTTIHFTLIVAVIEGYVGDLTSLHSGITH